MIKSASVYTDIPFKDMNSNNVYEQFKIIDNNINRKVNVLEIDKFINNINISNLIEAGIYEYTGLYAYFNNINENYIIPIYENKYENIISNIDPTSKCYNQYLINKLIKKEINPQNVPFLEPHEINPDNWNLQIKRKELKELKKNNVAATNLYFCKKCKNRKCRSYQMQIRSIDEPMTTFVECLVCFKEWTC